MAVDTKVDLSDFLATPGCKVAWALDQLSKDERKVFEEALAHPNAVTSRIVDHFRARNVNVGKDSVMKHRQEKCACARA